jgi:molybdopterin-guanine dinucleotide biosynthesis protein A
LIFDQGNATCFINRENKIHEPLLTIYEPAFYPLIMQNFLSGNFSLSKLLLNETVKKIHSPADHILKNVNTPEEFSEVKKLITI